MLDIKELKVGDRISEQQYYEVMAISGKSIQVKNDTGNTIHIDEKIIARDCYAADQYESEIELTRTELINRFLNIGGEVFTVNYNKKTNVAATIKNVETKIKELDSITVPKLITKIKKELKKQLRLDIAGEIRTAIAYKTSVDFEKGRTIAIDMMKDKGTSSSYDNRILGNYYGYPSCCTDQFCTEGIMHPLTFRLLDRDNRTEASKGLGFMPCDKHAKQILDGKITLESLIDNKKRKCPSPFPTLNSRKLDKHLQDHLDKLERKLIGK